MEKVTSAIASSSGYDIKYDIYCASSPGKLKPIVIFSHGFKGFKGWGFIPYFCQNLAQEGAIVIALDYSMNGIADTEKMLYDSEIFASNTVSQEVFDLKLLIKYIFDYQLPINYDDWNGELILIGHSLGGAISAIVASQVPRVNKLITIGTISSLDRNTQRQKSEWKKAGYQEFEVSTTGQKLRINYSYQEDKDLNFPEGYLLEVYKNLELPILVMHPEQDVTVNIKEAKQIADACEGNPNFKLEIIPKAGHTLNINHPFKSSTVSLDEVISKTIKFLGLN